MNRGTIVNCSQALCWNSSEDQLTIEVNSSFGESYYVYQDVSFWQIPQLAVLIGLFIFIVFGNTGVLIAIGLSETGLKTRMNFFIVNLAVADLSVGLFHVTVDLVERCLVVWYGGSALCKIVRFLQVLVVYASTFMIVSLSIDRVDAIARPMNFTRKATTIRALVNAAWIMSAVLAIPSFVLFDTVHLNNEEHCIITLLKEPWHWQVYITLVALTAFVIPALIIIVCYSIIIFVIWDKGRGFSTAFQAPSCRNLTAYNEIFCCRNESLTPLRKHSFGQQSANGGNKGIIPQAKIRTLKMTLIIVCVFVFSWCPYFVFNLMDVYGDKTMKTTTQYAVTALIQSLAPLNSAANPIIYGLFGTRIFNGLRRIPCIAFCYERSCRCQIIHNCRQRKNSRYQTQHTYIDATSGNLVPILKRNHKNTGRHVGKWETSCAGLQSHSTLMTSQSAQNFISKGNGGCKNTSCGVKLSNEISKDSDSTVRHFHRRASGLPIVNRRMTLQESILLETYRPRTEKNGKTYEKVCQDEAEVRDLLLCDTNFERFQKISEVESVDNSLQD